MITSRKLVGNAETISAYHTKEENYYFSQAGGVEEIDSNGGPAQPHVRVYGGLASRLGFAAGGSITEQQFTYLLQGKNANGVQVTRQHKVHGIDLTFSAPKSVSVAGLLTLRDPRIIEAHDRAVLETMEEIERHCAGTRPSALERVSTGNLAYVAVRDGFNRDHDPHLHTHVVVANMTALGDKVLAVDGRQIMTRDFNKAWGGLYRAKLAAHLKELGYSVSYTKKGELRMDAVSLEVEREFSGRRNQIEAAKAKGARDMQAWRETRKEKDAAAVKADILADWRARLAKYAEKTPEANREAAISARAAWCREAKWSVEACQELAGERATISEVSRWHLAARRATENSACVKSETLIAEYLAELGRAETWEYVTYAQAERRLQDQVDAGYIMHTEEGFYTTWELMRADRECVSDYAGRMRLALESGSARRAVEDFAMASRRGLSERQADVAAAILSSSSGVVVVQGDAGAGKTTMLKAVHDVAAAAGWDVVGVAAQGVAARKLEEEAGVASKTLASYLSQERAETAYGAVPRPAWLVIIDEASMLDSRNLAELLRRAETAGDKVVLVGDRNQLQSVGAGKPFERLVESAEASGALLSLGENFRQRDDTLRKAVDLARTGRMRESLQLLDGADKLLEIEDAYERRLRVANLYTKDTLILTGTREGRDALNKLVREGLLKRGQLDGKTERAYSVAWADDDGVRREGECRVAVGERITFLQNEYARYDVRNGEIATVLATGKKSIDVRLENGRELSLDLSHYSAIAHGYALTTFKSQGQTYDKVVVEADTRFAHLQDQRNCYVQITRARCDVKIFTDDRAGLMDLAGELTNKKDTLELKASLSHSLAMERRVREEALQATAAREASAKIAQAEGEAAKDTLRMMDESAEPVRIQNAAVLDLACGVERVEKALAAEMKALEDHINKGDHLHADAKRRLAEFFSRPETVDLVIEKARPELRVVGAKIALGIRRKECSAPSNFGQVIC